MEEQKSSATTANTEGQSPALSVPSMEATPVPTTASAESNPTATPVTSELPATAIPTPVPEAPVEVSSSIPTELPTKPVSENPAVVPTITPEPVKTHPWWKFWDRNKNVALMPTQPDMSHELAATAAAPEQLVDSKVKLPEETPTSINTSPAANIPETKAA